MQDVINGLKVQQVEAQGEEKRNPVLNWSQYAIGLKARKVIIMKHAGLSALNYYLIF